MQPSLSAPGSALWLSTCAQRTALSSWEPRGEGQEQAGKFLPRGLTSTGSSSEVVGAQQGRQGNSLVWRGQLGSSLGSASDCPCDLARAVFGPQFLQW